jgi:hypothetical protein
MVWVNLLWCLAKHIVKDQCAVITNMSYATNTMCRKCHQLTLTGEQLPCGRILCRQCKAKWTCSCSECSDKNTFVVREGFCKICFEPVLSAKSNQDIPPHVTDKNDLCEKCKTNTEMKNNGESKGLESIWGWLWGVGSMFTCGPLIVADQSRDELEEKEIMVEPQSYKVKNIGVHAMATKIRDERVL